MGFSPEIIVEFPENMGQWVSLTNIKTLGFPEDGAIFHGYVK